MTLFRGSGQIHSRLVASFLRIPYTKNCWNRLIFDWVIQKIKRGTFFGTHCGLFSDHSLWWRYKKVYFVCFCTIDIRLHFLICIICGYLREVICRQNTTISLLCAAASGGVTLSNAAASSSPNKSYVYVFTSAEADDIQTATRKKKMNKRKHSGTAVDDRGYDLDVIWYQ